MLQAIRRKLAGRSGGELAALVTKNLVHAVRLVDPSSAVRRYRAGGFDRRWGTDTTRLANLSALDVDRARARHGVRYQPSSGAALAPAVERLAVEPQAWTLIDYGSGKGRVAMLGAAMGFRRVIGVEFSPELCLVAEENVRRFTARGGAATAPEIVLGDAGQFEPPPGPLLAYLYNPFSGPVLEEVVARLEAKARGGDPVAVCYVEPRHLPAFTASGAWEVVARDPDTVLMRSR
jgi:hypothetical protein